MRFKLHFLLLSLEAIINVAATAPQWCEKRERPQQTSCVVDANKAEKWPALGKGCSLAKNYSTGGETITLSRKHYFSLLDNETRQIREHSQEILVCTLISPRYIFRFLLFGWKSRIWCVTSSSRCPRNDERSQEELFRGVIIPGV